MVNKNKLKNSIRKLEQTDIDRFDQSFVIVPYKVSGYIDYANTGMLSGVNEPTNYETFKRIWTGNDAIIISWKNSVITTQDPETLAFNTKYQLGNVFLGELLDDTKTVVLDKDKSFSDYTAQQTEISLQFRVSNYFEIDDSYEFMLFKFPELHGSTLFRIETNEEERLDLKTMNYKISFKSINQELANTGKARQQNIMPNSPGQGYLEAIVKEEDWPSTFKPGEFEKLVEGVDYYKLFNRYITSDKRTLKNRPIKKVVVKLFGAGILNSFTATGRPARNDESFEEFGIPRLLFPFELKPATTPTLYRSQQSTSNFYYGSFVPSLMFMKDMMSQVKDSMTPLNKWNSQGTLIMDRSKIKATNPLEDGTYKYDLYGTFENNVLKPFEPTIDLDTIDTSLTAGCEALYKKGGQRAIHTHLFDAYFTQKNMKTLPMNSSSSLGFGFTLGSSIGALVTKQWWMGLALSVIGISASLITRAITPKFAKMYGLVSSELVDMNDQYGTGSTSNDNLSMNLLLSQSEDNPSSIFFAGNTMQTSFEADLTDNFLSKRVQGGFQFMKTTNIGQENYENGSIILESGKPFLLNGDAELAAPDENSGFIIDSFQIQAVFNGEISVEFLDENGDVAWSGVYQSEGKWTDSLREIWTEKNTSVFGRENMFFEQPLPYPKLLPEPITIPGFIGTEETLLNLSSIFQLSIVQGARQNIYNGELVPPYGGIGVSNSSYSREFIIKEGLTLEQFQFAYTRFDLSFDEPVSDNSSSPNNILLAFDLSRLTDTNEIKYQQSFSWNGKYTTWYNLSVIFNQIMGTTYFVEQEYDITIKYRNNQLILTVQVIGSASSLKWTTAGIPVGTNFPFNTITITGSSQYRSVSSSLRKCILRPRK